MRSTSHKNVEEEAIQPIQPIHMTIVQSNTYNTNLD